MLEGICLDYTSRPEWLTELMANGLQLPLSCRRESGSQVPAVSQAGSSSLRTDLFWMGSVEKLVSLEGCWRERANYESPTDPTRYKLGFCYLICLWDAGGVTFLTFKTLTNLYMEAARRQVLAQGLSLK